MTEAQRTVTWLHLTDLHRGQPGDARWNQLKAAILRDMQSMSVELGAPDLVLFTGDLAFRGVAAEYDLVNETLDEIYGALDSEPVLIAVPGNHDLSRPDPHMIPSGLTEYLRSSQSGRLFRIALERREASAIDLLKQYFSDYLDWFDQRVKPSWVERGWPYELGPLPGDFRLTATVDGLRIAFAGANSAFLDLSNAVGEGGVVIEAFQLGSDTDRWAADAHAALLLQHHPREWMAPLCEYNTLVYPSPRFVAALCGHMHVPTGADETRPDGTWRYRQAPSLLGLERYLDASEDRILGYAWGRLETLPDEPGHGRLSYWMRKLVIAGGGNPQIQALPAENPFTVRVPLRTTPATVARRSVSLYRPGLAEALGEALSEGERLYNEGRFEDAREVFRSTAGRAQGASESDCEFAEITERAKLAAAVCLLVRSSSEGALEELRLVELDRLSVKSRCLAAQAYAQLGEPELASSLLDESDNSDAAKVVRDLVEIAGGNVPIDPAAPFTRAWAALLLVEEAEYSKAASWALEALAAEKEPGVAANAVEALLAAAENALFGPNPGELGPAPAVVQAINALVVDPPVVDIVGPIQAARWAARLAMLSHDDAALRAARQRLRSLGATDTDFGGPLRAVDENRDLRTDGAQNWERELSDTLGATVSVERLEALVQKYPRRPPVLMAAAHAALRAGDPSRGKTFSEAAFRLWPGTGQALLLARAQLAANSPTEALSTLEACGSPASAETLHLRASAAAAAHLPPSEVAAAWAAYVDAAPDRVDGRVALSTYRNLAGERELAVANAREFLDQRAADLRAEHLLPLASVLAGESNARDRERALHSLALLAHERAALDGRFAAVYAAIWHRLGTPRDLPLPDVVALEKHGAAIRVSVPEGLEQLRQGVEFLSHVARAYDAGQVPFETLAAEIGDPPSLIVARVLHRGGALCAAPPLPGSEASIQGKPVLLGQLELLLLAHFDCLDAFLNELGENGRAVLFRDVLEAVQRDSLDLALRPEQFRHDAVARVRSLLLRAGRAIEAAPLGNVSDHDWAEERGLPLVSSALAEDDAGIALSDFVEEMRARRLISQGAYERLFVEAGEPSGDAATARVALDGLAMSQLLECGALDELLRSDEVEIHLAPSAMLELQGRQEVYEIAEIAAELAGRVQRFLTQVMEQGRLRAIERPDTELPPVRDGRAERIRSWLSKGMTWLAALVADQELHLLSADLLGSGLLAGSTPAEIMGALNWVAVGRQRYLSLVEERHVAAKRRIPFGRLVRNLAPRESEVVEQLSRMGFADALDAADILELVREWGDLRGPTPVRLLDALEAPARTAGLHRAATIPLAAVHLYVTTMWSAAVELGNEASGDVIVALLDRVEALPQHVGSPTLQTAFLLLLATAVTDVEHSFLEREDGMARLGGGTPAEHLWTVVGQWIARDDKSRRRAFRAAFSRAVSEDLVGLDETTLKVRSSVLFLAANEVEGSTSGPPFAPGSALEAISIASADWKFKPLAMIEFRFNVEGATETLHLDGEALLVAAAETLASSGGVTDTGLAWRVPLSIDDSLIQVQLPPDAVLLRSTHDTIRKVAPIMADAFDASDGSYAAALRVLGANPDDEAARRQLVERALRTPAKHVRVDASNLLQWGAGPDEIPASLEELRELLCEPGPLTQTSIVHEMRSRIDGAWQEKPDLFLTSAAVPGTLSDWLFISRVQGLGESVLSDLDAAASALLRPSDLSISALIEAFQLVILGVHLNSKSEADLAESVARMVANTSADSDPQTIAGLEARLLQLCSDVVLRLAHGDITPSDLVWLTWRLYQWLIAQSRMSGSQTIYEHLRELAEQYGGPRRRATPDPLDPIWYGEGRFEHRLAAVLRILAGLGDTLLGKLDREQLREALAAIASRPKSETEKMLAAAGPLGVDLGWGEEPRSVSELAEKTLVRLRRVADAAEPESTDSASAEEHEPQE